MNVGGLMCGMLCIVFLLLGFLFHILKEKAAILISGFNTIPKEQRALYDKGRMSKDQRNVFYIWAAIMGAGAIGSYLISGVIAIVAGILWLVVFFKDVHLDEEKAFAKYKLS